MDSRHVVLKLFVNELGEPGEITDFENRKIFQKAVYLGQLSGVDLGYRYSWYFEAHIRRNSRATITNSLKR